MKNDINLLIRTKAGQAQKTKIPHLLRIVSVMSVVAVLLTASILYILSRQLSLDPIKISQNSVINNINFLKKKQARLIVVREKLGDISKIIAERPKFNSDINTLLAKVPSGVSSRTITLDKQKLVFRVESNSLKSIDEFINNFVEMARSKNLINSLTLGGLTLDPASGNYGLNIEADKL